MRFISLVKANESSEAGNPPSPALMQAIGKLAEEMARAGVLLGMEGLLPSSHGARIRLADGKLTVIDGPFTEAKELVGGYAILQAASKEEAIEHGRRFLALHAEVLGSSYQGELELRELFDAPGPEAASPAALCAQDASGA